MKVSKKPKLQKKQKQTAINEVPLSGTLEEAANRFLRAVDDSQWDDEDNNHTAEALVIVFRTDGNGGVNANVLNWGLTDETQNLMANAALEAINGKPLFWTATIKD